MFQNDHNTGETFFTRFYMRTWTVDGLNKEVNLSFYLQLVHIMLLQDLHFSSNFRETGAAEEQRVAENSAQEHAAL